MLMTHYRFLRILRIVTLVCTLALVALGALLLTPVPQLFAGELALQQGSFDTAYTRAFSVISLTAHVPTTNDLGVAVDQNITASFDADVEPSTVTTRTFTVRSSFRGLYTDTATVSGSSSSLTLDPSRDFFPGEQVQVVGTDAVRSTGGAALKATQWGFTAGPVSARCFIGFTDSGTADDALTPVGFSSVAWGDYDNDGDLDLLITGNSASGPVAKLYRNDAGIFVDSGTADDALTAVNESSVAWGDYDNDGDLDLLITGNNSANGPVAKLYRNDAGIFVDSGTADDALTAVNESSVAWGDYDNDGDLDLLITGNSTSGPVAKLYRNDAGIFVDSGTADDALTAVYSGSVAWGDYDNDGDLDLLITGFDGGPVAKLYRNDAGIFVDSGTADDALTAVYSGSVAWGDYDNDGDLDLLITGFDGGPVAKLPVAKLYRNDAGIFVDSGTADDALTAVNGSSVAWGDYDNDGDLDLLITGYSDSGRVAKLYRNDAGIFVDSGTADDALTGVAFSSVAWGDYDNDGDLDLLITGDGGSDNPVAKLYRNGDCADVAMAKAVSPAIVAPGGAITYTLAFSNPGPDVATGVVVSDSVPVSVTITGVTSSTFGTNGAGSGVIITQISGSPNFAWDVSDLAVGAGGVITLTGTVINSAALAGTQFTNTATITATNDITETNNSGSVSNSFFNLTSHVPTTNALSVAVSQNITASFNADVEPSTVTTRTFTVRSSFRGLYTDTATVSGSSLTLDPSRDFFPGEQVQVVGTDAMRSTNGAPLNPAQWGFTAGPVSARCFIGFTDNDMANDALTAVRFSSVAWGDYDNDGDLDLLITGHSADGRVATLYRNDAGTLVDSGTADDALTAVDAGSVAWGDYDNDGDLDLLITGNDGDNTVAKLYRNDAGTFVDSGAADDALTGVNRGSVAWGDYDNDGDLDLLITGNDDDDRKVAKLYRNDAGIFADSGTADDALTAVLFSGVAWGDYDNDGDLDLLITGYDSSYIQVAKLYRNDGPSVGSGWIFSEETVAPVALTGVGYSSVAWGDYDSDGDLDLLITGNSASGKVAKLYRNDGPSVGPGWIFTEETVAPVALTAVFQGSLAWGDYDNDGDLDLLITGKDSASAPVAKLYRNDGPSAGLGWTFVDSDTADAALTAVYNSSVAWGDYDNDGDLDLLITGDGGSDNPVAKLYRNGDCADVAMAKAVSPAIVAPGGAITYTLAFSNPGPDVATGVVVSDSVPVSVTITGVTSSTFGTNGAGSGVIITQISGSPNFAWDVSDLAVGAGGVITLTGTVINSAALAGTQFTNTATITATNDITETNNSGSVSNSFFNLTSHVPTTNALSVAVSQNITASFNADVEPSTVTTRTFTVRSSFRGLYTDTATVSGSSLTLDPSRDFFPGEQVQVVGTDAMRSTNGAPLNPAQWGFTAGPVNARCFGTMADSGTADDALTGVGSSSVAWGDYDNDGDLDLLITGYDSSYNPVAKLYRNDAGIFADSGTADDALTGVSYSSVAWGDYDNDGDLDLIITGESNSGPAAKLYRNDAGTFVDSGTADDALTGVAVSSVAWGDYDNDGDLDLLLTGYSDSGRVAKLYRNDAGTFVDSGTADDALIAVNSSSVAWGDYDNDGDLDLIITGDSDSGRVAKLYRNDAGIFADSGTALTGVHSGSVAWGDYDSDGDLDLLLTGYDDSGPVAKLYRNDAGIFADSGSADDALTGVYNSSVAWGDYDNDGDLDLLLTGDEDDAYNEVAKLYRNDGPSAGSGWIFTEQAGAAVTGVDGSSVAWGDYDNDGDLDLLITGYDDSEPVTKLYRNDDCRPDVVMAKTVSPAIVAPGGTITYSLNFSNAGTGVTTDVVISDSVPVSVTITGVTSSTFGLSGAGGGVLITQTSGSPNFTWTVSDLAAGAGGVITLTGVVSNDVGLVGQIITNTATITASNDITATNNSSDAAPYRFCGPGTYLDTSTNLCVDASPGEFVAVFGETSAAQCEKGTYQPNSGQSQCLIAPINTYVDVKGADTPTSCPAGTFNPLQGSAALSACLDLSRALTITKTVDNSTPNQGDTVTFTVAISNSSSLSLTNAILTDTLPVGLNFVAGSTTLTDAQAGATLASTSAELPSLASGLTITDGARITVTFQVTVGTGTAGTPLTNTVALSSTQMSVPFTDTAALTPATPEISITAAPSAVDEDSGTNLVYTVTRTAGTAGDLTVNFDVGGTATLGTDYTPTGATPVTTSSGTVTIVDGNSSAIGTVHPVADSIAETDETVVLTLTIGSGYSLSSSKTATTTITNDDTAGVSVSPTTVSATEGGANSSYGVVLTTEPTSNVTLTLSVGSHASVSPSQLVFTPANWATTQSVVVTAVDDDLAEGPHVETITHAAASTDANYNAFTVSSVTVNITDNDSAGVSVTPTTVNVTEGGANSSYGVVLTTQPTADVTINLSVGGHASVSPTQLVFTPANWDTTQSVVVTAVDDNLAEGPQVETITHAAVSTDANYNGFSVSSVTVNITDNDSAGVSVTPTTVSVTEGGANSSYGVVLTTQPTADVTINLSVGGHASVSPTQLVFTPANWDTTQSVVVTAVDDDLAEGPHVETITHAAASTDANYNAISVASVTVNITDNDSAGISVTPATVSVTEGGAGSSYGVVLTTQPTSDVTLTLSVGGHASVSPSQLVFTPANWDTTQSVVVTAVDDDLAEGPHVETITHAAVSADGNYNAISVASVTVNITDNDSAGVSVTPTTVSVTEGGANSSYGVVLTTQPTADVTINLSVGGHASVSPTQLVFTPANWDTTQSVSVSAVDDDVAEGAHVETITHAAVSTDANYNVITVASVTVNITDNDSAGVSVTPTTVNVTEGGAGSSYGVVLTTQPTSDVTLTLSVGGHASVSPSQLVFTPANWNTTQSVVVTAVDDNMAEGPHVETITHAAASTDANYNAISVASVTVNITDNDSAGISVTPTTVNVTEGGANSSYGVVLTTQPTADVTINLSVGGHASVSPTQLVFTPANWDTTQSVVVTAVDDDLAEGPHVETITHAAASTDANYNAISVASVTVNITDNDSAGISVTPTTVSVTEGGANSSYGVVLTTQPTADVTINLSVGGHASVSPSQLVFTPANWATTQSVSVSAVDDNVAEGTHVETITHAAVSADSFYNAFSVTSVTVNITDNDSAGISVTPTTVSVTEGGASSSYGVVLTTQPTANVTLTLTVGGHASVSPSQLVFTPANWATTQSVSVSAVDDNVAEGTHVETITHAAVSADSFYNAFSVTSVTVNITDNDSAGISVTPTTVSVTEGGASSSYGVVLTTQPTANVTLTLTVGGHASVSPSQLVFTPANWATTQSVSVSAVDDDVAEGTHVETITHAAVSADSFYNAFSVTSVTVNITDNDSAGISVTPTTVSVTEGGASSSYGVVLTTQPTANVTLTLTVGGHASVSPSQLVFTPANWATVQSVSVSAVDDNVAEGAHVETITHAAVSADSTYNGFSVSSVTVNITDNDDLPTVSLAAATASVAEGVGTQTFTVTLSRPSSQTVRVTYTSTDGTAVAGQDYTGLLGTLILLPGQTSGTFSLAVIDDYLVEFNETLTLTLQESVNANLNGISNTMVTIVDNDEGLFMPVVTWCDDYNCGRPFKNSP